MTSYHIEYRGRPICEYSDKKWRHFICQHKTRTSAVKEVRCNIMHKLNLTTGDVLRDFRIIEGICPVMRSIFGMQADVMYDKIVESSKQKWEAAN